MPGTNEEMIGLAGRAYRRVTTAAETSAWKWADGDVITAEEYLGVIAFARYIGQTERERSRGLNQRKAMCLLRTLLSAEQQRTLRGSKDFIVTGSLGGVYRIIPRCGRTERVVRHGTRWFSREWFCFHDDRTDPAEAMPNADIAIAHLLLLMVDEGEFLERANGNVLESQMWNGDYVRRLRQARQARLTAAPT